MSQVLFKYRVHPGDFFRNAEIAKLPNPEHNFEEFLIWFLDNYQSDSRIAYIDDLSKAIEEENITTILIGDKSFKNKSEIQNEIEVIENELKAEAYENFYRLLRENKIEIITDYDK